MATFQSAIKMDKSTGVYQHKNPWMKIKTNQSIKKVTGERVIHQSIKNENKVVGEINEAPTFVAIMMNLKKGMVKSNKG